MLCFEQEDDVRLVREWLVSGLGEYELTLQLDETRTVPFGRYGHLGRRQGKMEKGSRPYTQSRATRYQHFPHLPSD